MTVKGYDQQPCIVSCLGLLYEALLAPPHERLRDLRPTVDQLPIRIAYKL